MRHVTVAFLLLLALLCSTSASRSQLALQETFNTPVSRIDSLAGWSDIPAGSNSIGSTQGAPYIAVNAGTALSYTGYIESGVGNAARLSGGGQDAQVVTSTFTAAETLKVYLAFLIRVDSAKAAGDYVWIARNTSSHNRWRMWLKSCNNGNNFVFGISKGASAGNYTTDTTRYTFGTTYLVVAKYNFGTLASTTDAKLSLWVNPASSSFGTAEDPSPVITNYTETATSDFASINRFALVQNGTATAPTFLIGGIRMGLSWSDVLPPSPSYYKGTGLLDDPNNWGTNLDGSGTHPDFTAPNQLFIIRNTPAVSLTGTWSVTGSGSRVVVGPGVNFTLPSGSNLSVEKVDVNSGGTLTINGGGIYFLFGNIAGTVTFEGSGGTFYLDTNYLLPSGAGWYELKNGNLDLSGFSLLVKGRLRTNGNTILGTGTFTLDSAATLSIASPQGITSSGAAGDIQTSVRQYSRYASYTYAGATSQVTGDAIPDTVANLTIQMSHRDSTVTLSKPVATTGNLNLTLGKFRLGPHNLFFSNPSGQSDSSYVITDSTGALIRPITNTVRKTMPIGTAREYRPAVLTFDATPAVTNVSFRYVPRDPGSAGLPADVPAYYTGGYWVITPSTSPGATFKLDLNTAGISFDTTGMRMRVLRRPDNTTSWSYAGNYSPDSSGFIRSSGTSGFGDFAVGKSTATTGVDDAGIPGRFSLEQNYPNPFNPVTTLRYQIPSEVRVTLDVFNILGQKVATLLDETKPAGSYSVKFDASRFASGLYLYRLTAGSYVQTRKMLLTK